MSDETAQQAYDRNIRKANARLQTLADAIKREHQHDPHWGHVGDIKRINDHLAEVARILCGDQLDV